MTIMICEDSTVLTLRWLGPWFKKILVSIVQSGPLGEDLVLETGPCTWSGNHWNPWGSSRVGLSATVWLLWMSLFPLPGSVSPSVKLDGLMNCILRYLMCPKLFFNFKELLKVWQWNIFLVMLTLTGHGETLVRNRKNHKLLSSPKPFLFNYSLARNHYCQRDTSVTSKTELLLIIFHIWTSIDF